MNTGLSMSKIFVFIVIYILFQLFYIQNHIKSLLNSEEHWLRENWYTCVYSIMIGWLTLCISAFTMLLDVSYDFNLKELASNKDNFNTSFLQSTSDYIFLENYMSIQHDFLTVIDKLKISLWREKTNLAHYITFKKK